MSVKVHIERGWATMSVRVTVYRQAPNGDGVYVLELHGDDELSWRHVPLAEDTGAPTMTLPEDVLAAIVAAGGEIMPPDRAQGTHLADAVKVRDRLLTLVEQLAGKP